MTSDLVVRVRDLRKSFRTPEGELLPVVDVPRFELARAQQVAVAGYSGSGKTTFLHLLAGILQADSGTIEVNGAPMAGRPESQRDRLRARSIGYIFQTFNLLQGYTALENVALGMMFGAGADEGRALALLQRVGLGARLHYRPAQLSVGQQQRVAIARALAGGPAVVLADEPTGNLDRARAFEALELIRESCREIGAALLLVSHDQEILARFGADRLDLAEINRAGRPVAERAGAH